MMMKMIPTKEELIKQIYKEFTTNNQFSQELMNLYIDYNQDNPNPITLNEFIEIYAEIMISLIKEKIGD